MTQTHKHSGTHSSHRRITIRPLVNLRLRSFVASCCLAWLAVTTFHLWQHYSLCSCTSFFFTQHLENTLSCTRTTFRPSRETVLYFHSPRLCGTKRRCISTHGRKKVTRVRTALNSTSRKTHAAQKRLCSTNLVAPCTRRRRLLVYGGDRVNILFQDSMFEGLQTVGAFASRVISS